MDAERSSLCNWVVNFLLEENYLLTAFELLHELLDDGRDDQAIRLKLLFSDPAQFPPDQISRFNSLRVADPQSLLEEKITLEEKLAVSEYELRLAQEDTQTLKNELLRKNEYTLDGINALSSDAMTKNGPTVQPIKRDKSLSDMGPLKDNERLDLNCAVKEYLLLAGYRLTAMTFLEEVTDQNLDVWQNPSAYVPDALRHYYYQYMSSTAEAAEEKIAMLREKESLLKESDRLKSNQKSLLKSKELSDAQVTALTKSIEALQSDIKDKENLVQDLRNTLEGQRKELNDCRAEITSLKMYIEGARSGKNILESDELIQFPNDMEILKGKTSTTVQSTESAKGESVNGRELDEAEEPQVNDTTPAVRSVIDLVTTHTEIVDRHEADVTAIPPEEPGEIPISSGESGSDENFANFIKESTSVSLDGDEQEKLGNLEPESDIKEMALGTIQILSDSLPKIVPYVLINHREELLPLIMCAIERHPESSTRDSLTHTLFNLIKRPDEQQRRIIMDACVTLAKNVGELRTETELLPQCWEQINHMYEERRLLVAQSCGDLAKFVRPEIRDSLILSIVQQLIEDPGTVVREAAAHNLALLLPLFPNTDKYIKVEEIMFQLICDPAGAVVETTIKELVPALLKWGNKLDHILQILLSHILGSAQRCPPLSGVEGSVESHLHVLGERERWNIDVLLRLLAELLPYVHQKATKTCPFPLPSDSSGTLFSLPLLEQYAEGNVEWPPVFEWLHIECFPNLIHLTSLLPQKEDHLRTRVTRFLLAVAEHFGEPYLTNIMLPVFLLAVGDNADLKFFPSTVQSKIRGLKPLSAVSQSLATMCTLPLLLAGILGHPSKHEQLTQYLRSLLIQSSEHDNQPAKHEIIHSVRFVCTFEENHTLIFNILWEMVASSNINVKTTAANLLKVVVPFIDVKIASAHVLPALVTLGSDQNLTVKYASIDAFGAVAQNFKNDTIVEKIRVQMDAFLEDGSHEATIAVVRSLLIAVPHTTERLRDYLVSKIYQFTASQSPSIDVIRRRERTNAFCEAIRALDATDVSPSSVRDFLIPSIQNLLRDTDALDPAHKEALEIILKDRSGGTLDAISKVMGAHLGLPSSVTSFFGESGYLLGKKDSSSIEPVAPPTQPQAIEPAKVVQQQTPPQAEDTRLRRIMRGGFTDMLRGKTKSSEDMSPSQ